MACASSSGCRAYGNVTAAGLPDARLGGLLPVAAQRELHAEDDKRPPTKRFHSAPRKSRAAALPGASGSTNWGRKAMKKSATFGLSTLVKNPCTNTVPG